MKIDKELLYYLNNKIKPRYENHDKAHNTQHLYEVLDRALMLGKKYGVEEKYIYPSVFYHDLGLDKGRDNHEKRSAEYLRSDKNLYKWFDNEEIELMSQAVEDHRASSKNIPRSLLGKIISDADRIMIPERVIQRSLRFNRENYPYISNKDLIEGVYQYLNNKYGKNSYSRLYLPYQPNINEQTKLKRLLQGKKEFEKLALKIIKEEKLFPKVNSILGTKK